MSELTDKLIAAKEKSCDLEFELEQDIWNRYIKKDYEEWEREQLEKWLFAEIVTNKEVIKKQQLSLRLQFSNIYQRILSPHWPPHLYLAAAPNYKLYTNSWEWFSPKKLIPLFNDGASLNARFFTDKIYNNLKIALRDLGFTVSKPVYRKDCDCALEFTVTAIPW